MTTTITAAAARPALANLLAFVFARPMRPRHDYRSLAHLDRHLLRDVGLSRGRDGYEPLPDALA